MFSANAKKDSRTVLAWRWFFQASASLGRGRAVRRRSFTVISACRGDVQRSSTRSLSSAPIAIDTHSTEKSIWPIGGMIRARVQDGSQSCESRADAGRSPGDTKLVNA